MTAITDAKLIIETALGHSVTTELLLRIAIAYTKADPHSLADFANPEAPTNEEMAQLYINTLIANGKAVTINVSDNESDSAAETTKIANRDAALADWV